TIGVLLNPARRCPRSVQIGWIMCQPSHKRARADDGGRNGLLDFVSQRCGQFSHHIDSVDASEISFQLAQFFTLRLGTLSFCYIHGDTDVLSDFPGGIVMPYGAQKSNAAVGEANSV